MVVAAFPRLPVGADEGHLSPLVHGLGGESRFSPRLHFGNDGFRPGLPFLITFRGRCSYCRGKGRNIKLREVGADLRTDKIVFNKWRHLVVKDKHGLKFLS